MKKPKQSTMTNKLDKACSLIVRARGVCIKCGLRDYPRLQPAHIYSRRYLSVRWDLENILCLCAGCHFWGHQNPLEFARFVETLYTAEQLYHLKMRKEYISKYTVADKIKLYEKLETML